MGTIDPGNPTNRAYDFRLRFHEYFLTQFARAKWENGGQFHTPAARRLAVLNLSMHSIEADLDPEPADVFHRDLHPDLRADYVVAYPPFAGSGGLRADDVHRQHGASPQISESFAWVQHMLHHLAPEGTAGIILPSETLSSQSPGDADLRRALVEADLVECVVALPEGLFYDTPLPACLWLLTKSKQARRIPSADPLGARHCIRDRRGETLLIEARKQGKLIDRVRRELTHDDFHRIAYPYGLWKLDHEAQWEEYASRGALVEPAPPDEDRKGFCKSATTAEIAAHGYVLTPALYVGTKDVEDGGQAHSLQLPPTATSVGPNPRGARGLQTAWWSVGGPHHQPMVGASAWPLGAT